MKLTQQNLTIINIMFVVALVISNIVAAKAVTWGTTLFGFPFIIQGADFVYAVTYLMTDVIGELWGKAEARKTVIYGFIGQIMASLIIFGIQFLPAQDPEMQAAYVKLFGLNYVFVIASLCAYFTSQFIDVWVFHKIRAIVVRKTGSNKHRWIWNNCGTMISQIFDTVLFIGISFGIGFGWLFKPEMHRALVGMIVAEYAAKFVLAALDTPFFYLLTNNNAKKMQCL